MMIKLLMIAAGGAIGALLRYGVSGSIQRIAGDTFPLGTLVVNVLGCFAIGMIGAAVAGPILVKEEHRVFLLIGLLGSFTTFSTFGWETIEMLQQKQMLRAAVYVLANNALALTGVWIGLKLAEHWVENGAT